MGSLFIELRRLWLVQSVGIGGFFQLSKKDTSKDILFICVFLLKVLLMCIFLFDNLYL